MAYEDVSATMKHLKEIQTSLTSLMDSRMNELHESLAQFASAKAAPSASSPPGDHSSAEHVNVENGHENGSEGEHSEGDKKNNAPKENPPLTGKVARRSSMRFLLPTLLIPQFPILI